MTNFVQALRSKYVEQDDLSDQIYIPNDKLITTQIKLVGLGKVASIQKQLRYLASIDLSNQKINSTGQIKSLDNNLSRVRVANLANNNLNWSQLIEILDSLPNVQELIITSNQLEAQLDQSPTNKFPPLNSLVIGRTHLKWKTSINILSLIWTYINDLDFFDSHLTNDDMLLRGATKDEISFVQKIASLRLSQNSFPNPEFLRDMGPLDNLTELDLSRCKLASFQLTNDIAKNIENLDSLNISYNDLTLWSDVSSLYKLKKLKSLICHENPFFISRKVSGPLIVGRIKTIVKLNREEITPLYRRDSEIYYLRSVLPEHQKFKKGLDRDFVIRHPRFNELAEVYGLPHDPDQNRKDDKYWNLELYYNDQKVIKKLPRDMRVSNLRMLVKRLFKLNPSTAVRITCCSSSNEGKELQYDLDVDSQILSFYLVDNDKKLIISKID